MSISLPVAFEQRMKSELGDEEFSLFQQSLEKDSPTSIRLNPRKKEQSLMSNKPVPWAKEGYYLRERPVFTLDPLFHAGCYYVQEASSMFLDHVLRQLDIPSRPMFLDLAAAPGGKSTLLSAFLGEEGLLVANEVIKSRTNILKENIIKWGIGNTIVTQNDPEHFSGLEGMFDLVLVDAPCSGEGMFRKDHEAIKEWSENHVVLCASRQTRIMDQAAALVKAGGYLIYSTCTYNAKENEDIIRFVAEEFSYHPVRIPLHEDWGIRESIVNIDGEDFFGYRFFPHLTEGEGFFISVMQRSEEAASVEPERRKNFKHPYLKRCQPSDNRRVGEILGLPEHSQLYELEGSYFYLNGAFMDHFETICRYLNFRYFGIELGKFHTTQWIPSHQWALSTMPKKDFPQFELDMLQALAYLRKEDLHIQGMPEGWVCVTYKDFPLGWIKKLGNRSNNYYPKDWRIRMKASD